MDLNELRNEIDTIDKHILSDFIKRMEICKEVALYKQQNNLPIFQNGREGQILNKISNNAPDELENASTALFSCIMDISKCLQQQELSKNTGLKSSRPLNLSIAKKIACQGVEGSNSEQAVKKIFGNEKPIKFYHEFEDVFKAVENGEVDFGVLPIQNSTAGSVTQTYDLMSKYKFYINTMVQTEICHCLAINPKTDIINVKKIYSHPQALSQCSIYLHDNGFQPITYENTATSAKLVSESLEPIGAICSESCAKLYGLNIIQKGISNSSPNYTRFICISKDLLLSSNADTISIMITIPNVQGSLYRLLTKFFVNGLNLKKIESRPLAGGSFNVVFYLDFEGNINNSKISALLAEFQNELEDFKFLGNYNEII